MVMGVKNREAVISYHLGMGRSCNMPGKVTLIQMLIHIVIQTLIQTLISLGPNILSMMRLIMPLVFMSLILMAMAILT
jgi:hypothetical protein